MTRCIAAFAALVFLASCGEEPVPEQPVDDERSARGEVLGGTISDEMLPLATRRSQSPPLSEDDETQDESGGSGDTAASEDEGES